VWVVVVRETGPSVAYAESCEVGGNVDVDAEATVAAGQVCSVTAGLGGINVSFLGNIGFEDYGEE
jgi:hypothetical protein